MESVRWSGRWPSHHLGEQRSWCLLAHVRRHLRGHPLGVRRMLRDHLTLGDRLMLGAHLTPHARLTLGARLMPHAHLTLGDHLTPHAHLTTPHARLTPGGRR